MGLGVENDTVDGRVAVWIYRDGIWLGCGGLDDKFLTSARIASHRYLLGTRLMQSNFLGQLELRNTLIATREVKVVKSILIG